MKFSLAEQISASPLIWISAAFLAGILLASGAGALGCAIGGTLTTATGEPDFRPELGMGDVADADLMPSATGLAWRALLVWLVLLLLLTLANWAP